MLGSPRISLGEVIMPLTLEGIPFDGDPQTDWLDPKFLGSNVAATAQRKIAYRWDCKTQLEASPLRLDQQGRLSVSNIIEFYVRRIGSINVDKTAILLMKAKVLSAIKVREVSDLVTATHRAFGKHKIRVDTSGFDWLKPIASYRLWLEINYQFFKFTNATRGLEFYVGLPHSADISVEVLAFCRLQDLEPSLEVGKSVEDIDLGIALGGTAGSKELRRRHLRELIEQLSNAIKTDMLNSAELRKERERYQEELKALE